MLRVRVFEGSLRCLPFTNPNRAAALATGCELKISASSRTSDLRQNEALGNLPFRLVTSLMSMRPAGDEVANVVLNKYGTIDYEWGIKHASTDFVSDLPPFSRLSRC